MYTAGIRWEGSLRDEMVLDVTGRLLLSHGCCRAPSLADALRNRPATVSPLTLKEVLWFASAL